MTQQEAVFFIPTAQALLARQLLRKLLDWRMAEVKLHSWQQDPITAVYCRSQRTVREANKILAGAGVSAWESDIKPVDRFLMERFITASAQLHLTQPVQETHQNPPLKETDYRPKLRMASIDIETSMDAKTLYSIAVWSATDKLVFMVGAGASTEQLIFCPCAADCLRQFLNWVHEFDPDILIGWAVVQFDLWVLENLCKQQAVPFSLGRASQAVIWRQEDGESGRRFATIPGRIALDGIEMLKAANHSFTSYSLENVAQKLLGEGKLLHGSNRGEEITELFLADKQKLAEYNLRDCELVWDIFEQLKLLNFAIERSQLTGLPLDRIGGSVAAFEFSYLPRLHRRGYVAPNLGELQCDVVSPGGYVMESRPGIYDNVLVLDFKSLYPSIIRTFLIDPVGFWIAQHQELPEEDTVPGFNGACFSRQGHILPDIIEHLSSARDQAKAEKNAPLSHAIKILMNSFYGVLGSTGCRFFDPRVCSSITLRGHEIIQQSRSWIEEQGYAVIYGDTDSLFVWLEDNNTNTPKTPEQCQRIGRELTQGLNQWWATFLESQWRLSSALEIQFETHYLRFFMPTIRGSELGTKKRYAGVVEVQGEQSLVFKGLESVRTDWTQLAKTFQLELYRKMFAGEDYTDFIQESVAALLNRECDEDLIYHKRLRRHLQDYKKNIPPHVQAARKLQQRNGTTLGRGEWVQYVITHEGPEPIKCRQSKLDYQHYIDRQLAPIADSILQFSGQSMAELLKPQLGLFS